MTSVQDVAVRLADEGVPIAAIARATGYGFEDVVLTLKEAIDAGKLIALPTRDWKVGSTREDHANPPPITQFDVGTIKRSLHLTKQQAQIVQQLLRRPQCSKMALHAASLIGTTTLERDTEPKIVDIVICNLRSKLARYSVEIETIWGYGYALTPDNKAKLLELIVPQFSPARSEPQRPNPDAASV